MNDETYNGWSNRETWAMALNLDNDEGLYTMTRKMARDALSAPNPFDYVADRDNAVWVLAEALRTWADYSAELVFSDAAEDRDSMRREVRALVGTVGSIYRVTFTEIATNYIAEVTE